MSRLIILTLVGVFVLWADADASTAVSVLVAIGTREGGLAEKWVKGL